MTEPDDSTNDGLPTGDEIPTGDIPLGGTEPSSETPSTNEADDTEGADDSASGGRFGTRQRVVAGVAAIALLVGAGWAIFGGSEEPPPPTTTTTTTEKPTTTVALQKRPALISQVATAKPDESDVTVLERPPPEWETASPVITWDAPEIPASQAESDRPELPREDYPLEGRYRTPVGWTFSNPTPFGDAFTVLVVEQRGDWAEVMLPVRPNGTRGYVDLSQFDLSEHDYRVELDLSDRHLVVYKGTEKITDTQVVVGRDATRTPTGRFYITDKTDDVPSGFYGPHVFPLNGYSEQLDTFDGGVPVIAMHGTSRPDLIGQAASNGCVRLPNEVITQLNEELPIGTQVEIYA